MNRRGTRLPIRLPSAGLLLFIIVATAPSLAAQYPHAHILPRGALQVSFEPSLTNYDERYGPEGQIEPLGLDLTADSAGPGFLPTLLGPQLAVRSIIDDPTYGINAGSVTTRLDADIRRFPFHFALGLTDRLTVTAVLPIVTTRMQVDLALDSTDANVGWNQAVAQSGNADGRAEIQLLLDELGAAAASVESQIAAGAFGCPSSAMCDQARDVVARTRALLGDLALLTGVGAESGDAFPPFAPLAGSAAGQALLTAVSALGTELMSFGASPVTATLPLPTGRLNADDLNTVLTATDFGYNALPLEFAKRRNAIGDAEIGIRYGLLQSPMARVAVAATVRLPTGSLDDPGHFVDLGTGDEQTDVIGGLELALEPGSVAALALSASYTVQLGQQVRRRITIPERPIALERAETVVRRDLGDMVQIGAYPSIRLNKAFRVYLSGNYFRKFRDQVTIPAGGGSPSGFPGAEPVEALERETEMEILSLGGGIYFRASEDRAGRPRLPVEAGLDYRTAFDGKGGLTPRPTRINFYVRLYYGLWWKSPEG